MVLTSEGHTPKLETFLNMIDSFISDEHRQSTSEVVFSEWILLHFLFYFITNPIKIDTFLQSLTLLNRNTQKEVFMSKFWN